jgi:hypothetical protein
MFRKTYVFAGFSPGGTIHSKAFAVGVAPTFPADLNPAAAFQTADRRPHRHVQATPQLAFSARLMSLERLLMPSAGSLRQRVPNSSAPPKNAPNLRFHHRFAVLTDVAVRRYQIR